MKKIALVLGAVCVALVVAVVLLLVFRMRNNAGKSGESAAVQTVSVTEVTAGETTNEAATEAVAAVAETTAAPATEAPTQAPAETAAVKRTADYSLYLRAVKQFVLSDQLVYREYYLYDIDRDGVNELIVQSMRSGESMTAERGSKSWRNSPADIPISVHRTVCSTPIWDIWDISLSVQLSW